MGIATNPINCIVPAMANLYEKIDKNPMKVVGITTLDIVRANRFVHDETGQPIENIKVPVVGGHDGTSIVPLFSRDSTASSLPTEPRRRIDKRVQAAGTEVL